MEQRKRLELLGAVDQELGTIENLTASRIRGHSCMAQESKGQETQGTGSWGTTLPKTRSQGREVDTDRPRWDADFSRSHM